MRKFLLLCFLFTFAGTPWLLADTKKTASEQTQKAKAPSFNWEKFFPNGIMKARAKSSSASKKNLDALKGKFVVLYHSANWCTHCHRFTPELIKFYKKNRKHVEVVFQSGDKSEKEMNNYAKSHKMPWYALPFGKKINNSNQIAMAYPSIVVYSPDGKFFHDILGGPKSTPDSRVKDLEEKIKAWVKKHS